MAGLGSHWVGVRGENLRYPPIISGKWYKSCFAAVSPNSATGRRPHVPRIGPHFKSHPFAGPKFGADLITVLKMMLYAPHLPRPRWARGLGVRGMAPKLRTVYRYTPKFGGHLDTATVWNSAFTRSRVRSGTDRPKAALQTPNLFAKVTLSSCPPNLSPSSERAQSPWNCARYALGLESIPATSSLRHHIHYPHILHQSPCAVWIIFLHRRRRRGGIRA